MESLEESNVLGIPCKTLGNTTERREPVNVGTNQLLGIDEGAIGPLLDRFFAGRGKRGANPPPSDGRTATRIVEILERILAAEACPGS